MNEAHRKKLWDAINRYAHACGGDTSHENKSGWRMDAVVDVENLVSHIEKAAVVRAMEPINEALNTQGVYKP